jgi:hypothetical protein
VAINSSGRAPCFHLNVEVDSTLIRLPYNRPKSSNEEFTKLGKEACKFILPAYLPSSLIFCQETVDSSGQILGFP